ncbi:MAG TPA: hypothetical protein VHP12_06895 [Chitinophagaceae bacterium]|nr:hypothetical protein [Chitinophagaceae bacterium]
MSTVKIFENKKVRSHYDSDKEVWSFSIVDIVEILTESPRPRKYWSALKTKLKNEGSELYQSLGQLKLQSDDGKFYKTDVGKIAKAILNTISQTPRRKVIRCLLFRRQLKQIPIIFNIII